MEMTQSHLRKRRGDPLYQILLRTLGPIQLSSHAATLSPALRCQFIHLKRNHFSLPYWVPNNLPFLLALSHTLVGRDTVRVLTICHYLLRSPAPGQNPMCNISDSIIRNYKALPGKGIMGKSYPFHTRLDVLQTQCNFLEGVSQELSSPSPHPSWPCSHTCLHS